VHVPVQVGVPSRVQPSELSSQVAMSKSSQTVQVPSQPVAACHAHPKTFEQEASASGEQLVQLPVHAESTEQPAWTLQRAGDPFRTEHGSQVP